MPALLRAQTAPLHDQIEALLGLPAAICTRDDYVLWLARFLGLYEPLERALAGFPRWDTLGFASPLPRHSAWLAADLVALGADPAGVPRAPPGMLPDLPTFAHALGTLYVLEGATLGGRVILRDLVARIGVPITGATGFFGGRGQAAGPMWQSFRTALDAYGRENPGLCPDVVTGAERTFRALLAWFLPFGCVAERRT